MSELEIAENTCGHHLKSYIPDRGLGLKRMFVTEMFRPVLGLESTRQLDVYAVAELYENVEKAGLYPNMPLSNSWNIGMDMWT